MDGENDKENRQKTKKNIQIYLTIAQNTMDGENDKENRQKTKKNIQIYLTIEQYPTLT